MSSENSGCSNQALEPGQQCCLVDKENEQCEQYYECGADDYLLVEALHAEKVGGGFL
jgi:hypothetical protein